MHFEEKNISFDRVIFLLWAQKNRSYFLCFSFFDSIRLALTNMFQYRRWAVPKRTNYPLKLCIEAIDWC